MGEECQVMVRFKVGPTQWTVMSWIKLREHGERNGLGWAQCRER